MTEKLTAFEAYQLYLALKLHFSSDDYDFFQYKGKVRASQQTFEKNVKQRSIFYKLAAIFPAEELKILFAVNLFNDPKTWALEFFSEECKERMKRKMQFDSAPDYYFRMELDRIFDKLNNPLLAIKVINDELPVLYTMYVNNEIMPETFVIMDSLLELGKSWKLERYTPFWERQSKKLKKYEPFVTYDKKNLEKTLVEKLKVTINKETTKNDTIVSKSSRF